MARSYADGSCELFRVIQGEKEPPCSIDERSAGDENERDRDNFPRPRVDLDFPVFDQRAVSGTHFRSGSGPRYSARGRMSRLFEYCSRTCAVQPDIRLTAKNGVNRSIGIPL